MSLIFTATHLKRYPILIAIHVTMHLIVQSQELEA